MYYIMRRSVQFKRGLKFYLRLRYKCQSKHARLAGYSLF